jgi:hypothetical protein
MEIERADWSIMMNFSTLSDFNWIHRVTQDIILVLRTNKDLRDVSGIFIIRSSGTPISRSSLKDRANSCNGTTTGPVTSQG